MAIKLFELGFLLKVSGATAAIEQMQRFSNTLKATEQQSKALKDVGQHLAVAGAAAAGLGLAVALPLKDAVESFEEQQDHIARLGAGQRDG